MSSSWMEETLSVVRAMIDEGIGIRDGEIDFSIITDKLKEKAKRVIGSFSRQAAQNITKQGKPDLSKTIEKHYKLSLTSKDDMSPRYAKSNASRSASVLPPAAKKPRIFPMEIVAIDLGTKYLKVGFTCTKQPGNIKSFQSFSPEYPLENPEVANDAISPTCLLASSSGRDGTLELVALGSEAREKWKDLQSPEHQDEREKSHFFENFKMGLSPEVLCKVGSNNDPLVQASDKSKHRLISILRLCFLGVLSSTHKKMKFLNPHFKEEHISKYMLTVPTLWDDDALRLRIVLEPEAAAVCWVCEEGCDLKKDDVITVLDMGGGTVDITSIRVHSISKSLKNPHFTTEVLPSGGPWGSKKVDEQFIETFLYTFMQRNFGEMSRELLESFKQSTYYLSLADSFEVAKKRFSPKSKTQRNSVLFSSVIGFLQNAVPRDHSNLMALVKQYNDLEPSPERKVQVRSTFEIIFTNAHMESFFDSTFSDIIKGTLDHLSRADKTKYMVPAGGFSQCSLLRDRANSELQHLAGNGCIPKIMELKNPQLAIAFGALQIGMDESMIRTRFLKKTYGVEFQEEFDKDNQLHAMILKDNPDAKQEKKVFEEAGDGEVKEVTKDMITGIFKPLPGLERGKEVSRNFDYILNVCSLEVGVDRVDFDLYVTETDDCKSLSIYDSKMKRFGKISAPIRKKGCISNFKIVIRPGESEPTVDIFSTDGPSAQRSGQTELTPGLVGVQLDFDNL